ncbi:MAG: alkaline phosphatase, partial [Chloroflexota bacterium]
MKQIVRVVVSVLAALVVLALPVTAQDAVSDIVILPVNGAQFLPGGMFDLRVEVVGVDALPEDFAVTVNGEDAADFFGMMDMEEASWTLGEDGPAVAGAAWRGLSLPESGEYEVSASAGGMTETVTWTAREIGMGGATNVILFIADGGSVPAFTATRLLSRGMTEGTYNDRLVFEEFEELGLISTSGIDSIMTDSANSASSYNTGHKSSVNATGVYADSSEDAYDDPRVETFAEMITRTRGMSVGVVATSYMQDATPAAVWGHSRERNSRSRCDFARALVGQPTLQNPFVDVMPAIALGGGAQYAQGPDIDGSRCDGEIFETDAFDLYEEAGYALTFTNTELQEAVGGDAPIIGVYAPIDLNVWLDRNVYTDNLGDATDQPGLVDMVTASLDVLSTNDNGFYLQVEAASIDKQFHPMDFERGLADAIEFERAVAATMDYLEEAGIADETLVIVTADHGHSFDVFGTVDTVAFNAAEDDNGRRDAIGVYAGAGFPTYADEDGDFFPDEWDTEITLAMGKVENPPFTEDYQVSEVPRTPSIRDENGVAI